ncbi:phosphotransferase family enzyme [Mumia flava]|uniref:Phosphotransferase family enzyme n=1 Tax=Mumia flava TaxID=1348852 RepID=A0A0B2BSX2_9ACTN|nr:phosphotransferase [Mumia flava]PJJ57255.1 phosphotransferase family enzyme [Mumia flava]
MTPSVEAPDWCADPKSWPAEVAAWVDAMLRPAGRVRTGAPEQVERRPWAIVLRIPTDRGTVWFKDNVTAQRHEAALVATLSSLVPGAVLDPIAVDGDRGWLLMPDGGCTVHDLRRDTEVEVWAEVVGRWAATARALADHTGALTGSGVDVLGAGDALAYLQRRTEEIAMIAADDPAAVAPEALTGLRKAMPALGDALGALDRLGLPDTLVHNDLHTSNVFAPGAPDASWAVFDLGDALLSSPLADLLVPLRFAARARGTSLDDPELAPVVDAAFDVWADATDPAALRAALPGALVLGCLCRSESWRRIVTPSVAEAAPELATASPDWLLETVALPGVTHATDRA